MNVRDTAFDFMFSVNGFLFGKAVYDNTVKLEIASADISGQIIELFEFIVVVMALQTVVSHYFKNHLAKDRTLVQFLWLVVLAIFLAFFSLIKIPRLTPGSA